MIEVFLVVATKIICIVDMRRTKYEDKWRHIERGTWGCHCQTFSFQFFFFFVGDVDKILGS